MGRKKQVVGKKTEEKPEPESGDFMEIGGSPVPGLTLRHVLRGHTSYIHHIAWSPDGRYLASPSHDKTIRIWDGERGECVVVLEGHQEKIFEVAWSPDGCSLASRSRDKTIRIWEAETWENLGVLEGHKDQIRSVAWSPDGYRLASGSYDRTIRIWDAKTKDTLTVLKGHEYSVLCVAWSPDGQRLASGSSDNTVRIWNPVTGSADSMLQGHSDTVQQVAWVPNRSLLASCSHDKTILLWDVQTGKSIQAMEGHTDPIFSLSFFAHGPLLASTAYDGIRLWRTDTWETVALLKENYKGKGLTSSAFHPRLPRLATPGKANEDIRIWDLDMEVLLGQGLKESVRYTTAKIVLTGDSGVGKTGLGWRLAHGEFKEHASTHGQQFWVIDELCTKRKDGTECEAVLWDLAGQHVYRSVHAIFLDDVDASLVLFDPSNRQEPLKGAQFWLEQLAGKQKLPPAVLVGARTDRGESALSQPELEQFCRQYGISGGYLSTSAKSGQGLEKLLDTLKKQIPWEQMTATVTTVTFKRIKEYILALKEQPDRQGVLTDSTELRASLLAKKAKKAEKPDWQFDDAEMMTAIKHLENHGYVTILRASSGEEAVLLAPELLADLASSIVLQADKHPRDLGALSETMLLRGDYAFSELDGLETTEREILLDAAVVRFINHKLCFRETLGAETLLIFPGLIKQKRPIRDEVEFLDDVSYLARGRVENVYAALAVLLGYTPSFIRINQWQNQAQYEMGEGEICGFRLIEEREGELELVLYYSVTMPDYGRTLFQGLFEKFLYQRDVEVTRFPPVVCPNGHRQERSTVIKRIREGKKFLFCEECGEKISLPKIEKPRTFEGQDSRWIQREEALAHLRGAYETHLARVKGFRRDRAGPRCYISSLATAWAANLRNDLLDAGVYVISERDRVIADDWVVMADTPLYQQRFQDDHPDAALVRARLKQGQGVIALSDTGDFWHKTRYAPSLFDLVLKLYAIPLEHPAFAPLRKSLHQQWEETLAEFAQEEPEEIEEEIEAASLDSVDVVILTVLAEEYQAVCKQIGNLKPALGSKTNLYAWKIGTISSAAGDYSVAVGMMGRPGTNESALATEHAITRWHPRYLFFTGIAGGLAEDTNKGDVVIANTICGYEYGKLVEKTFESRDRTYRTDIGLLNGAVAHSASNWKTRVRAKPPAACSVKVMPGEIASGDKVVDNPDNEFFSEVLKRWPKVNAVEMEGAGAGNAIENARALGNSTGFMMIRGISDLPRSPGAEDNRGTQERDTWKDYAADTAAAFTVSFIAGGLPLPPATA
ncbi:MAG: hypothetical protein GY862_27795 [Gammaproteobacteria bacterium]|nr:hypothetical protein [Gammaproteobacteria bacterium]